MDKTRLIFEPSIHVLASTVMTREFFTDWAIGAGLEKYLRDASTPLGKLLLRLEETGKISGTLDELAEVAGRFCYRSWAKGRESDEYIRNIIESEHGSVFQHCTTTFAVQGVSRSLSHELVRHYAGCAPSQESQRFVDATTARFVVPPLYAYVEVRKIRNDLVQMFYDGCMKAVAEYEHQSSVIEKTWGEDFSLKRRREAARNVLPNATETRLVWTMNMRAARHVCALRGSEHADLEIRRLAVAFTRHLKAMAPLTFDDMRIVTGDDGLEAVVSDHPKI